MSAIWVILSRAHRKFYQSHSQLATGAVPRSNEIQLGSRFLMFVR